MNRSRILATAALVAFLGLTGCAGLVDVTPQTVDESLATAQIGLVTANKTFTTLVLAGKVPKADAERVSEALDLASSNLVTAKTLLRDREFDSVEAYLKLVEDILNSVNQQLAAYQS